MKRRRFVLLWGSLILLSLLGTGGMASHGSWIDHYRDAHDVPCCGQRDCRVVAARLMHRHGDMVRVEVNGVPLVLSAVSVHVSEDTQDWWCAVRTDEAISVENTRCLFVASGA